MRFVFSRARFDNIIFYRGVLCDFLAHMRGESVTAFNYVYLDLSNVNIYVDV